MNRDPKGLDRRSFLRAAASATAALGVVPRSVLGGPNHAAPSGQLTLACIGMGWQGTRMLSSLLNRPDVRVVAVCDPNTDSSDYIGWGRGKDGATGFRGGRVPGREAVEAHYGKSKPSGAAKGCAAYADFREMLEKEADLDAVHIVTPDHTHATLAIAAMKKGMHAAMHKPVANRMHEARLTVETARKTGRLTHLHAWGDRKELYTIREWIRQGVIGPVRELHRWLYKPIWPQGTPHLPAETPPVPAGFDWDLWLGPVPHRPYSPRYTHAVYRGWYEFGGGCMADMGYYGLWKDWRVLDLGAATSAEACASIACEVHGYRSGTVRNDVSFPHASTVRLQLPARGKMPPCDVYWYDGGMRPPTPKELLDAGQPMPRAGVMFVGDDGKILAGYQYEKPRVLPDAKMRAAAAVKTPDVEIVGTSDEWINAFRSGRPSRGRFENVQNLAEAICLSNVAIRLNTRLTWDPAAMRITNHAAANRYLRREKYREGWKL